MRRIFVCLLCMAVAALGQVEAIPYRVWGELCCASSTVADVSMTWKHCALGK